MRCRRSLVSLRTVFIRRKGPASPKVSALVEVLMEQSDLKSQPIRRRKSAA
jgi:hypothetical protein